MRISIERSGGFAGINKSYIIDTDTLPSETSAKIKKMVQDGKLFGLGPPSLKVSNKISADHYSYKVTLEEGKTKHIVSCDQFNIQKELKSLVDYLEKNIEKRNTRLPSKKYPKESISTT